MRPFFVPAQKGIFDPLEACRDSLILAHASCADALAAIERMPKPNQFLRANIIRADKQIQVALVLVGSDLGTWGKETK